MKRNVRQPMAATIWIASFVIVLSLCLQPRSISAAQAVVTLADSNQAWGLGKFFRTGLASSNAPIYGGVQLIPAKVQQLYAPTSSLPIPLAGHSTTTYRDRIFVIGGNTKQEGTDVLYKSSAVYTTRISNPQTGDLQPWVALPSLTQPVSDPSSVVVEVEGKPYLVVMGGMRGRTTPDQTLTLDSITTGNIYYYPINLNALGNIDTSKTWTEVGTVAQRLPFPDSVGGASAFGAVSAVVNNQPYIYMFGGSNRTVAAGQYTNRFSSRVYRALVTKGSSGNTLTLSWQEDPDDEHWNIRGSIDNTVQTVHLSNPATVSTVDPLNGNTGVYLIGGKRCLADCGGGQLNPPFEADINAYVARINASSGIVDWLPSGNMTPEGRYGLGAIESEGQIVISGGRGTTSTAAMPSMAEGYILPDLTLEREGNAANFSLTQGQMSNGRMFHSMATLDGGYNGDWSYLIGGTVSTGGTTTPATVDVLFGNLDEEPLATDNFVASGNYYSKTYDFGTNAKYFDFRWTAIGDDTKPIRMFYRSGNVANNLSAPVEAATPVVESQTIENGATRRTYRFDFPKNTAGETLVAGQYFQFIAQMERSSLQSSPLLKGAALKVERQGFPNIKVPQGGASMNLVPGTKPAPVIAITNQEYRAADRIVPALPANWDGEGSFFVGLYILPPNTNRPRQDWPKFGDTGTAFAEVGKSSLPVMFTGQQFNIPQTTWRKWSDNTATDDAFWRSQFNQVGTYTVYVMVDTLPCDPATTTDASCRALTLGLVNEAEVLTADGETDNVSSFTVQVVQTARKTYIPMMYKTVVNAAGTIEEPVAPAEPRMWPQTIK